MSREFEAPPTLHAAPLISESSIVEIIVEQVTFEDLESNAENAQPVSTVEEDKGTVTQPEQCLLEKGLVVVESNLIEEPQHTSVTDVVQIADITKELEDSTPIDVVSVEDNAGMVEVLEKQDISEDIQVHNVASASVTAQIENETELLTQEAPPAAHISPLIPLFSIVEGIEKQVTSPNLLSNAEDADPVITVEDEKATVTQPEQSLMEKELLTLESDFSEEPQHISVTDDVQVAEVTKILDPPTHIHLASVESNAGIVEDLGNQVLPGDMPEGSSVSLTAGVENETGVLTEEAIVVEELPTMDYDHKEIPQQSVVKEDEVVKVSREFEAPPTLHTAPLISESSIVEIIVEQVKFDDLGSNAENAQLVSTVEEDKETVTQPEQCLLEKELEDEELVESDRIEEPQYISVKDVVQIADITKELEESIDVVFVEDNAGIVEVLEKQDISEDALPTGDDDPNEIPQQSVVKQDGEVVQIELEAPPTVQIAPLILGSSMVEVIGKQVLSEDIPVTDGEKASASTTAEAEEEAAVLIAQALVENVLRTVVGDPDEIPRQCAVKNDDEFTDIAKLLDGSTEVDMASINSDTSTPQVLQKHVLFEVIPTPDTDNAAVISVTEVTEVLEAPMAVKMVLINRETSVLEVFEKQHAEDHVALVVPEPSHEVVSTTVNDDGDINKLAEVEENAEIVEDGAAMQDEDGAAMQECSVKTSMGDDANRETPNIREFLLDVMATEEEPQDTWVQEGMIEMAEKIKGDVEVKSAEEVGVTDAKGAMDIGCKVQNEVENVSTSPATEEILDKMDNVTTKQVDQQENQTEESCLKEEPVSAVQVIVTPETDEQEATEMIQSEPSELEAQKVTENCSDASIERPAPEVLPVTEIGNKEETASINVFVTTDDVSIDKLKPDLDETTVELKKESDKNVIEEDSSCSPDLFAANRTIEAKQDIVVPQIITSSEKVQPPTEMGVEEIQATENGVESNIQMEVTELQVKDKIELTEPQVLEKVEPNIQKEVKELGTEQKSEPVKQIEASEVKVEANVAPKIQMDGTEFPATEKLESTLQMEETELQVTEEVEQNVKIALTNIKVTVKVVVQALEALDIEEAKVDAHLIEDSSFSPREVAATEMLDSKQEQTHPCEMVTPSEEGEPTIRMETTEIQLTKKVEPKIQMEVTELQGKNKVEPTIEMGATEIQVIKKVEPNIQIALTEIKDPLTECQLPEVGVQAVDELLETTLQHLVHIEQAERTMPSGPPGQPEVGVESAEPVPQGEGELEQDVWLDAEEDIGKQEGAEETGNEPQESVQSKLEGSQAEDQEEEFLDTTGHAQSSPEEIQAIGEIHDIEREEEDFAIALEDSQIRNLTETSLICKELD